MFTKLASKMGISSSRVLRQAEENVRLSQVRCTGLGNTTATSKAVICLELAAASMKLPIDKEYAIKLSGLNKQLYQSSLRALECLLGLEAPLGLRDLAVQYGCTDALKLAAQILDRYEASLPAAQQQDLDLSKSLFTTAALHSACKCLKMKVDRKLALSSGAKKGIFDRLCSQLLRLGQDICKQATPLSSPVEPPQRRVNPLRESSAGQEDQDHGLPTAPKQQREAQSEESETQDYETWKRKILENALKAKNPQV